MKKVCTYISETFNKVLSKLHLMRYKDIILFVIILTVVHFGLNGWNRLHFYPVTNIVENTQEELKVLSFNGAGYVLDAIGYDFKTCKDSAFFETQAEQGIFYTQPLSCYTYYFENSSQSLLIVNACSGFKQLLVTLLLLCLFPGPWKKKLWFIPVALIIMFITNILRIVILGVLLIHLPQYWDFLHMSVLRPAYYVVLFLIWVWWNEKYYQPSLKK